MNKKFNIFYTIFAAVAYLFAIGFFAFNLYNDYINGDSTCNKKYMSLVNNVQKYAADEKSNFYQNIKKVVNNNSDDYAFVQIKKNGTSIFMYPSNVTKEETDSKLVRGFETDFSSNIGKITVVTNIYLLKPYAVYYYARVSFLIILVVTLLTILMIIYLNISKTEKVTVVEQQNDEFTEEDVAPYEDTDIEFSSKEKDNLSEELSKMDDEKLNSQKLDDYSKVEAKKELEAAINAKEQTKEDIKLPYEDLKPVELESNNEAKGLFNPETGIGWEPYLLTRLDSELNRAIASEFDLALFIINFPGIDKDSELFKNICNYLCIQFQFKDLLFEYNSDCVVSMKINMNIDEALVFSEKIYSDLKNMLEDKECYIGISTRTIRMVGGDRLLFEAEQALKHAQEDKSSPVIAFRVDAEKYRQFFEHKQDN